MNNRNGLGYYSAPIYHDTPNYFEQLSEPLGQLVLLAVHHSQAEGNESAFGRLQLMVFPSMEVGEPTVWPSSEAAVTKAPCLPPYVPLQRGSKLVARGFPPTLDANPYQESGSRLGATPDGWRNDRLENLRKEWDGVRFNSTDAPPARQLFADLGLLRILRFGDFHAQLEPQLRYPERIQESHQLPCYVQVFEVGKPGPVEEISSRLGSPAYQFAILDAPAVRKLGLSDLPRPNQPHVRRAPGLLLPGDRVFRLQVVRDPTVTCPESQASTPCAKTTTARGDEIPEHSIAKPLKCSIPATYLSPWEFERTREEALRELSSDRSGWLGNLWRAMRAWTKRNEIRNWRSLLVGKSADDQLWGVPPPKWALHDRAVRRWARRTLAFAGYDSDVMFPEWEVFWRRKGF